MVLVGPSGCGKTTALRMIAGLEALTEGESRSATASSTTLAPQERDIAMVFQNYALYPHMSVFDNIAFPLRARGSPRAEIRARVEEAAALLELEEPARAQAARRSRAASASASRWAARSSASRRCS